MHPNVLDVRYLKTFNSVGLNNLGLEYRARGFHNLGCKDIGIIKFIYVCKKDSIPLIKKNVCLNLRYFITYRYLAV